MGKKAGSATPVVDKSKATEANLNVIKRIDPDVEEVLASSGHVCLYRMSVDDQQWQRKNVEGALFLVRRCSQPRHQLVVLNKVSAANHAEDVRHGMELEVNAPYLMYTYGDDEVHGVWFYEPADLAKVGKLLKRLLASLPPPCAAEPEAAAAASPAPPAAPAAPAAVPSALSFAPRGGDDAFWDRQVSVTDASIPPGHGMQQQQQQPLMPPPPQQQPQAPQGGGGGLNALLRLAQAKAGTPAPPPVQQQQQQQAPAPAPPPALLTPSFLLASAAPPPAHAPPPPPMAAASPAAAAPIAAAANGHTLQALLARAARPAAPAPAPAPPLSPYPAGLAAGGPPPSTPPVVVGGGAAGNAAVARERLRAALQRALLRDEVVDALAAELRGVGLL